MKTQKAFFVFRPRRIDDLLVPHLVHHEQSFVVEKEILLSEIDYRNFITDLYADRSFIEKYASLCPDGMPYHCLLVKKRKTKEGILVVPYHGCFVKFAAFIECSKI